MNQYFDKIRNFNIHRKSGAKCEPKSEYVNLQFIQISIQTTYKK